MSQEMKGKSSGSLTVLKEVVWNGVLRRCVFIMLTGVAANQQGEFKKRLMKYCVYAWGTPAIVVLICVTVDLAKERIIGYG